ncbi:MAG: hypothetical protein Q7W56_09310 [Candidatus Latescibacteria bacterium]|nr:hypothetical protein [Candidatus Latescibacterota bacterium]
MTKGSPLHVAAGLLALAAAPALSATLLSADFTGMIPGQPVGTGGPAVGEPVSTENCIATIRDAPFPSTCLEIDDETDFGTGGVTFEFLEDAEVIAGSVEISAKLWFAEDNQYYFYVRENGGAASSFITMYMQEGGAVLVNDAAGSVGVIGQFTTGRAIELRLVFNQDARTYDLWWDGAQVLNDRAHGVADRGVGSVLMGIDHDADLDGLFLVDDLLVQSGPITAGEDGTWGGIKAAWR